MATVRREEAEVITIGVDPHPGSHAASALSADGRIVGQLEVPNDEHGRARLRAWGSQFGHRRWAIEGVATPYAKPLADGLRDAGEIIYPIAPGLTSLYRRRNSRGKDDAIDSTNAARALLANPTLPRWAPPTYEARLKELTRTYVKLSHQLTACRMSARTAGTPEASAAFALVTAALEQAVAVLKSELHAHVRAIAPDLLDRPGVGPVVAAVLLAETGRITRFASKHHFAAFAGCAPVRWASGAHASMRVNPAGNRRLNWAVYVVVLNRLRLDARTKQYRDRKLAEGKTQREVFRLLKTYVCRELFGALTRLAPSPICS